MLKLREGILELYKKVTTSLPPDVEDAIRVAQKLTEAGSEEEKALLKFMEEIRSSRATPRLICMETGIPHFYVKVPLGISHKEIKLALIDATRTATEKKLLDPSAVDVVTGQISNDNTGRGFPVIHMEESSDTTLSIELMLAGTEAENEGHTYSLPDDRLDAVRDLDGVRKCIVDAVKRAGGRGCPPYVIGIGIGATREQAARMSKRQLLRRLSDRNPIDELASLEETALGDINRIEDRLLALGVKIGANHTHRASFIIDVSLSCWATRRGTLLW